MHDGEGDDRAAPGEADVVVEEDEDFVGDVDQELRRELEGDRRHQDCDLTVVDRRGRPGRPAA